MGVLGGKINEDLWLIETNNIDTDDNSGGFLDECGRSSDMKKSAKYQKAIFLKECARDNTLNTIMSIPDTLVLPLDAEQGGEQKQKASDTGRSCATAENHVLLTRSSYINKKYQLYKTEMCRSHTEIGYCKYGDKCQFAHSESELRYVQRHPKYKTETCKTFWEEGSCPYGKRCCFIHVLNTRLGKVAPAREDHRSTDVEDYNGGYIQIIKTEIDRSAQDKVIYTNIDESMSHGEDILSGPENKLIKEDKIEDTFRSMSCDLNPINFFNVENECRSGETDTGLESSFLFEPVVEDEFDDETMARKPFWETNDANIWMTDEPPLFYLSSSRTKHPRGGRLAPGGLVCKTFDKKISEFVLRHLNM